MGAFGPPFRTFLLVATWAPALLVEKCGTSGLVEKSGRFFPSDFSARRGVTPWPFAHAPGQMARRFGPRMPRRALRRRASRLHLFSAIGRRARPKFPAWRIR